MGVFSNANGINLFQEIIKERERIPYIGPLTKVIPLKAGVNLNRSGICSSFTRTLYKIKMVGNTTRRLTLLKESPGW